MSAKRVVNLTLDYKLVEKFDKVVKTGNRSGVIAELMTNYVKKSKKMGGK